MIRLREKIADIFLNYFKYNNVFIYIHKGNVMVLPPHKCIIGNTSLNGTPTVFFDVQDIRTEIQPKSFTYTPTQDIQDDSISTIYAGYPPEILDAVR